MTSSLLPFYFAVDAPIVDYKGLAPLFALAGGSILVLLTGLARSERTRRIAVPALALASLAVAGDLSIRLWGSHNTIVEGALRVDDLALAMNLIFLVAGAATVVLSLRHQAPRQSGQGEYYSLLLASITGMSVLAAAENTVTFFIGLELLSIPLYVLCGSELKRRGSLEAGLKYLVLGSVGSATLVYGLAFLYGATASTDFDAMAKAFAGPGSITNDPLALIGLALVVTGLCFKVSVAPFHQWTPDVYQGAPTPITAFMAVATKAAAFAVFLRFFDQALPLLASHWSDALAVLAVLSMVVGNVGAIGQDSLKRMLAYSGVAQAGYMLAGVVVATQLGLQSLVLYLIFYLLMNTAAFAVICARERESEAGDDIASMRGLGRKQPLLAWAMTVAMLSLAGFPATTGFMGKFYLIEASVKGDYAWLAVAIAIGTMISLVYYLRVVSALWLEDRTGHEAKFEEVMPIMAGGSPELDSEEVSGKQSSQTSRAHEITGLALLFAAATVFFGVYPQPMVEIAEHAGNAIAGLL